MTDIIPIQILEKIKTASAKEAFNTINELKPEWTYMEMDGKFYISPDIHKDRGFGWSGMAEWAPTLDKAVANLSESLNEAVKKGLVIVVNIRKPTEAKYIYDKNEKKFVSYEPKAK